MCGTISDSLDPCEETLSRIIKDDLGIEVNPQALRIFIRSRWDQIAPLAHTIRGAHVRNAREEALARVRAEAIREKQRDELWKGKL